MAVTDHGPGIPAEKQAALFQPFIRAAPPGASKGMGLGLYIAKGIAEAHGGRIWFETAPGRPTTFFVALPFVAALTDGRHDARASSR